jgi:multimeric flavodoxin WrbA
MFAIAINGSPRKNGNTRILLTEVLKPLQEKDWETELYQLGGQPIHGCTACGKCFENRDSKCIIQKDCFNELFAKIVKADAVIIGSPTYYSGMSSETKALIDRTGFVSRANKDLLRGKIGAAVAAVRRAGAVHVVEGIMRMYLISHMVIPGSAYWNLGVGRVEEEVRNDDEGIGNMRNLGETIALLGKAVAPYREEWPV